VSARDRLLKLERAEQWRFDIAVLDLSLRWVVETGQLSAEEAAAYRTHCMDQIPLDAYVREGARTPSDWEGVEEIRAGITAWVAEDPAERDPNGLLERLNRWLLDFVNPFAIP
jgi:hypothetical protein